MNRRMSITSFCHSASASSTEHATHLKPGSVLTLDDNAKRLDHCTKRLVLDCIIPGSDGTVSSKLADFTDGQCLVAVLLKDLPKSLLSLGELNARHRPQWDNLFHVFSPPGKRAISDSGHHHRDAHRY